MQAMKPLFDTSSPVPISLATNSATQLSTPNRFLAVSQASPKVLTAGAACFAGIVYMFLESRPHRNPNHGPLDYVVVTMNAHSEFELHPFFVKCARDPSSNSQRVCLGLGPMTLDLELEYSLTRWCHQFGYGPLGLEFDPIYKIPMLSLYLPPLSESYLLLFAPLLIRSTATKWMSKVIHSAAALAMEGPPQAHRYLAILEVVQGALCSSDLSNRLWCMSRSGLESLGCHRQIGVRRLRRRRWVNHNHFPHTHFLVTSFCRLPLRHHLNNLFGLRF